MTQAQHNHNEFLSEIILTCTYACMYLENFSSYKPLCLKDASQKPKFCELIKKVITLEAPLMIGVHCDGAIKMYKYNMILYK